MQKLPSAIVTKCQIYHTIDSNLMILRKSNILSAWIYPKISMFCLFFDVAT